jgi:hypothetical protein
MMTNEEFKENLKNKISEILDPKAEWGCCRTYNEDTIICSSYENPKYEAARLCMAAIFSTANALGVNEIDFIKELCQMFKDAGYDKKATEEML